MTYYPVQAQGEPAAYPGSLNHKAGDTLDGTLVHHMAHTHTQS